MCGRIRPWYACAWERVEDASVETSPAGTIVADGGCAQFDPIGYLGQTLGCPEIHGGGTVPCIQPIESAGE
jgi:hypothetical protein